MRCPRSDWRGWDVRTGGGLVRDNDIVTQCLMGEDGIEPSTTTTIKTTTTSTTTKTTTTTTDEIVKGI